MVDLYLKQPGFTFSACGPFTKNKERIKKFMQTENTSYIYQNDLDEACFQHDMAYVKCKYLTKRTESDNVLTEKFLKLQVIQNMIDMREDQLQWFTSFLITNLKVVTLNLF